MSHEGGFQFPERLRIPEAIRLSGEVVHLLLSREPVSPFYQSIEPMTVVYPFPTWYQWQ